MYFKDIDLKCGSASTRLISSQVVSACHGAKVKVWQIETGERIIMFKATEDDMEITAMSFDPTKRKLITGARDGVVKIWNFNNGACLRVLQEPDGSEVRYIEMYMKTRKNARHVTRVISHNRSNGRVLPSRLLRICSSSASLRNQKLAWRSFTWAVLL